ncbi:hypothetical protein ABFA07_002661 [Porites harrisoni]
MNTKVQSLLLALVLLASMFSYSEAYFPAEVGRKSSIEGADGSEDAFMGTRVTRDRDLSKMQLKREELCEVSKRVC